MSEMNRATILGTGTMGPGMAAVLARADPIAVRKTLSAPTPMAL